MGGQASGVSVAEARDFLRPLGEGEAKIQIVGGDTLRIQSQLEDPDRANEITVDARDARRPSKP